MITLEAFPEAVLGALRAHAAAAYPREACGVVFRAGDRYDAFACRNVHAEPAHHFAVGVRDRVQIALRLKAGDELAAIYHSHADIPAVFSDEDRRYAIAWPDALHLVMAVTARGVLSLHAFDAAGSPVDEPVPA